MQQRWCALGVVVVLLVGCATVSREFDLGPQSNPAPDSWAASREGRSGVDEQWISRFGDARLERLVAAALTSNHQLQQAEARVRRAATALKVSESTLRPDVDLSANARRQKQVFPGFPFEAPGGGGGGGGSISSLTNIYGTSLDVSWEVDLWGRIRAGNQAALADLQSEGLTYRAARASLIAQVAKAYFTAVEAETQVALARESLRINEQTVEAIQDRFRTALADEGGTGAQLRLAQTDFAVAEATLEERKGLADQTKRQLEILIGQYPKGSLAVPKELPAVPARPPVGVPSQLLLRRPDILAAERRYAASQARIKEAQLAKFPQFTLTGSLGTSTTELRDVLNSDFGQWSLGAGLVQPILINGRLQAEIEAREIGRDDASLDVQRIVLQAFGEVEDALAAERVLARREQALAKAYSTAKDATQAGRIDYSRATSDILTVLTAQNREIALGSQLSAVRRARFINRIDLHLALGGDYRLRGK